MLVGPPTFLSYRFRSRFIHSEDRLYASSQLWGYCLQRERRVRLQEDRSKQRSDCCDNELNEATDGTGKQSISSTCMVVIERDIRRQAMGET